MKFEEEFLPSMAGSLLVAHPNMLDPNFQRSVVLLSSNTPESGTTGIVINMPTGKTMGDISPDYAQSPLADVPLYKGGPMGYNKVILAAWQWAESENLFRIEFGISQEDAVSLLENDPNVEIRAFMGYTGWGHGQLEEELHQNTWILSSVKFLSFVGKEASMWHSIISEVRPDLKFLIDTPEDFSDN